MRPTEKRKTHAQPLMGSVRLDLMLNMDHELVRLGAAINWAVLAEAFGAFYSEKTGRGCMHPIHGEPDGKLGKNWLKGILGDALNAMLCGVGHNLRKILAHLRRLFVYLFAWVLVALRSQNPPPTPAANIA